MSAKQVVLKYTPQPLQERLHKCPADEILFGGAAGPGKSMALRMEAFIWCIRVPGIQVFLFRRTFPELETNHVLQSRDQFPSEVCEYKEQKRRWEFKNGSILRFCHCQHESDVYQYQGAEIHLLVIDELTTFTEFQYDYLRSRVRCTLENIPDKYRYRVPGIICASNPGGIGHQFAKTRWVDFCAPNIPKRAPEKEGGMLRCYIPGKLEDNTLLMRVDPGYASRLDALPEPYRTAYRDGNWDLFLGQAFSFSRQHHVIEPIKIPDSAPLYMSFDWGFGKPYSIQWFWVDFDGRLYMFDELYGCQPGMPDTGVRQTDDEIAVGIINYERDVLKLRKDRYITRLCDPTCFNKKPDYRGGGQGPSTADIFATHEVYLTPGDPSRILKIRQFHARLRLFDDQAPMFQVYSRCENFIRTIPILQFDDHKPEDIDTRQEDHAYDSACLVFMARPMAMEQPKKYVSPYDERIKDLYKVKNDDPIADALSRQLYDHNRQFYGADDAVYGEMQRFERRAGNMVPTVGDEWNQ